MTASGRAERYPVFDLLRIIAALAVLVSHSFALVGLREPHPIVVGRYHMSWGHLGVVVFFVTSGFLVTGSRLRIASTSVFIVRRVARIWPAFIAVVVATAFVLGPLVSTHAASSYLSDKATIGYVLHTTLMSPIRHRLPGVFEQLPSSAVNGSLWTLPYEILAYIGIVLLASTRRLGRLELGIAAAALLVLYQLSVASNELTIRRGLNGVSALLIVNLGVWFAAGAVTAAWPGLVVQQHKRATVAALALGVGVTTHVAWLVIPALAFLIVYVGTLAAPRLEHLTKRGDPSYGMYLYAFPVQQTLIWAGLVDGSPWRLALLSAPLTALFGYGSWHLIESPTIRRARRLRAQPSGTGAL